jgi:3-oxoacyl-[acyl-carrier-protein] synthase II
LRDVFISGIGVILPGAVGNEAFVQSLRLSKDPRTITDSGPIPESQYIHLLNARRVRRMSDYVKLTLAATMLACQDASIDDIPGFAETCGAILGTAHGSTNYCEQYYGQIVREGINAANPMLFAEGVPNAAAAHLSLMLSLKGPCQTVIGTRTAGLDALRLAFTRIASGEWERAIVGAAEEYSTLVNEAYRCQGLYKGQSSPPFSGGGFAVGCAAVTFILESARSLESRSVQPRGRVVNVQGSVSLNNFFNPAAALLDCLRESRSLITSANGTWIDRAERITLRHLRGRERSITSLAGQFPECFSVTPMAAIAAGLLNGDLPSSNEQSLPGFNTPAAGDRSDAFAVLASDYTRLQSAAVIALMQRSLSRVD